MAVALAFKAAQGIKFARRFAADPRVRALIQRATQDPVVRERFSAYADAMMRGGPDAARRLLMNDVTRFATPSAVSARNGATNFGAFY